MVEWLRLFPFLLLCVAVQGSELECDVVNYVNFCWQSETQHSDRGCWHCQIKSPQINTNETLRISGKLKNGTDVNVEHIIFFRSTITKIPNLVQKLTNQQIVDVNFFELGPTKLNSQLFEDYCEPLKAVVYTRNYSPVEGSAFQNCTNLEKLNLGFNQLSSIPFDAFYGLHKLIQLNLEENNLKEINPKWFEHLENLQNFNLNNNYLEEIPNGVFNKLTKLKTLELNDNSLISIRWKMFEQNTFLETISIYGNRIQRIEQNSFRHLSELTMLDLRYNTCINMVFKNETIAEIADALTPCKQSCIIPAIQNGNVRSVEDDSVQTPGDSLENSNSVKVYCNHSFQLFHDKANHTANKCLKDWEDPEWPTCQRTCPYDEIKGMSIIAHCERNDVSLQCSGHLLPGTKATIDCHSGYVKPNRTINKDLICLETGKWSHKAHQCEPSCGRLPPDNQLTKAPWHVGIHFIHLHNCSGTIISEHTVISVAHCFIWDSNKTGIERWERYHVSAGKILRPLFEDTEEQKKQERKIQEVKVAASYNNVTWLADIAIVTVNEPFEYQLSVGPACLQFNENLSGKYPKNGAMAMVAAWGPYMENKTTPPDILQYVEIPIVDLKSCQEQTPDDFEAKVADDKICAGSADEDDSASMVICQRDSGGGLMIPQIRDRIKRYYLQGVVANSQNPMECVTSFYSIFTNIQNYKELIESTITDSNFVLL